MAAVILKQTTIFVFARISARAGLLVGIVAAFEHVRLVDVTRDVDIFVAHYLCKIVTLGPRRHVLC